MRFEITALYMQSIPIVDMVNRVVSTKLTEEEHSKVLEICNDNGMTVSSMLKRALLDLLKKEIKQKKKLAYELEKITIPSVEKKSEIRQETIPEQNTVVIQEKVEEDTKYLYF